MHPTYGRTYLQQQQQSFVVGVYEKKMLWRKSKNGAHLAFLTIYGAVVRAQNLLNPGPLFGSPVSKTIYVGRFFFPWLNSFSGGIS